VGEEFILRGGEQLLFLEKYLLFLISFASFALGLGFYLMFREPVSFSLWMGLENFHLHGSLPFFNWFPSFVHQFSFVLFTWLVLERRYLWFSLLFWFVVNVLFELGQALPSKYVLYFPNLLANYFQNGTYSHVDMLALVGASLLAYILMIKYQKKGY